MSEEKRSSKGAKPEQKLPSEPKVAKISERATDMLRGLYHSVKAAETEYNNATSLVAAALGIDPSKITRIALDVSEFSYTD